MRASLTGHSRQGHDGRRRPPGALLTLTAAVLLAVGPAGVLARTDPAPVVVPFTCAAAPLTVEATGAVEPSTQVPGGRVRLAVALSVRRDDGAPLAAPGERLVVSLPVPSTLTGAGPVVVTDPVGLDDVAGTVAADRLTFTLTPTAGPAPTSQVALAAQVSFLVAADAVPGPAAVLAPDQLGRVPVDPPGGEPQTCATTAPPAVLTTVRVAAPPPPPAPTTVPPNRPPPAEDPAGGGDAPSPPPLPPDRVPTVPPRADPSAASRVVTDGAAAAARAERLAAQLATREARVADLERRIGELADDEASLEALRHGLAPVVERAAAEFDAAVLEAYRRATVGDLTGAATLDEALAETPVRVSGAAYAEHLALQADAVDRLRSVVPERARRQEALERAEARRDQVADRLAGARQERDALRSGGVAVRGLHLVVAGEASFTDTWLAPRSGGRRHQGTDVFADHGTPVLAAERGVLADVGQDPLGGTTLWLVGESGTHYYYAHLSGYAPGVTDGVLVGAGEVIGYVGDTGNARGTPPHLHLEIHPDGGAAVNPYPMLAAVADDRGPAPEPGAPTSVPPPPSSTPAPTTAPAPTTTTPPRTTTPPTTGPTTTVVVEPPARPEVTVVAVWGGPGHGPDRFVEPTDVALDGRGNVYVADAGADRVLVLAPDGTVLRSWGGFTAPTGIDVAGGRVYVADAGADLVRVFTLGGDPVAEWGGRGTGPGTFHWPASLAVGGGRVVVADTFNDRVQVFTTDGTFVAAWGGFGASPGRFTNPYGVALAPDGDVLVADTYANRVQRFSAEGDLVAVWGVEGVAAGSFDLPTGLEVGPWGEVTVVDRGNGRIQQFEADGTFLAAWGMPGPADGRLTDPAGVAVTPAGDVVVADAGNARVQVLRPA